MLRYWAAYKTTVSQWQQYQCCEISSSDGLRRLAAPRLLTTTDICILELICSDFNLRLRVVVAVPLEKLIRKLRPITRLGSFPHHLLV